ncbi:hypothetical protein DMENIID0001_026510 [Sergentomyia squamirostris]
MEGALYIFVIVLCGFGVSGENIYPTTVHQQGDTQTVYHGSHGSSSNVILDRKDQEDNVPAQSYQVNSVEPVPYDPSALSTSVLTQDAIQQYITQNAQHGLYPPVYYPGLDNSGGGYSVATGYEGYLVPSAQEPEFTTMDYLRMVMPSMPRMIYNMMRRVVYIVVYGLGYVLAGGGVTAFFCAVTPFCRLTFLGLPFLRSAKDTAKSVTTALANEITEERVKRAAELIKMALEKYQDMQNDEEADKEIQKISKKPKNNQ